MATTQPTFMQPPPTNIYQQQSVSQGHPPSGSVGMVIVVLAVITILGVVAGVVGRLCAGRRSSGGSEYDFEGWVEKKCSTCIDGNLDGGGGHVRIPIARASENGEVKPPDGEGGGGAS